MGLFDKIKKIFNEEKKEEILIEEIDFNMLHQKVDDSIKEDSKFNQKVKADLNSLINQFVKEAEISFLSLQKVDISSRKEHEKIKLVVNDNLKLYAANLRRLIDILKNLDEEDIQKKIDKLLEAFSEFNRLSNMAFQKATILIGSELADAKNKIKDFSISFNKIIDSNKSFFDRSSSSARLKSLLEEIKKTESRENELFLSMKDCKKLIEDSRNSINEKNKEIENIKSSEDYLHDKKKKEQLQARLLEVENSIQKVKSMIDFKLLFKIYHTDSRKNQFIKDYSNNFKAELIRDSDLEISTLVKEAQNLDLLNLKELQSQFIELNKPYFTKTDNLINLIYEGINELQNKISHCENEISEESKKKDKLSSKKAELIKEAKSLAEKTFTNIKIK